MSMGGCQISGSQHEVSAAAVPTQSAVSETGQKDLSGKNDTAISKDEIPVEPILSTHTAALTALKSAENGGIEAAFTNCLDSTSSLEKAWLKAISRRTPGAWMLLALRMAETNAGYIPKAIEMIEELKARDTEKKLEDIYNYHLGRLWMYRAEHSDNPQSENAWYQAWAAFSDVLKYRKSPYYHEAKAARIKAGLALDKDITRDLRTFILTYPDYPGLHEFKLALATLDEKEGRKAQAEQTVQDILYYYPWSGTAPKAEEWLKQRDVSLSERTFEEDFSRVESLRKARFWDDAEKAAVETIPNYPESYQFLVQHARIAYERSYHEEAAHRFESILEKLDGETKDKLRPAGVIAYIYRAYGYAGNCEKALEYFSMNAQKLGKKDRAKSTMEFALSCGEMQLAWENAKKYYETFSTASDHFQYGLIAYLNGEYETARQHFAAAEADQNGSLERRSAYFLAQATLKSAVKQAEEKAKEAEQTEKDGKKSTKKSSKKQTSKSKKSKLPKLSEASVERAKNKFESIISSDSNDYYAILAWSRLEELKRDNQEEMPSTPVIQTFNDIVVDETQPRPWNDEFSFDESISVEAFDKEAAAYISFIPELERVSFLHEAELYRERNALFRAISIEVNGIRRLSKRPNPANLWTAKYSIDGHLIDNRRTNRGYWGCDLKENYFELPAKTNEEARSAIAKRQTSIYDAGPELRTFVRNTLAGFHDYYMARKNTPAQKTACGGEANLRDCSILYPHAYSEAVLKAAKANHVTPDLIWSLMNIESAFNPDSISHSDAYGLLQIIPMTGYKIAEAMGVSGFGPYDLIRPERSITMGTWYFSQILHKFHGYATLSMASYNGGPHQVARWLTAWSGKMEHDAFIELIPYDEARNYVKKGMARLLIFHRIDRQNPKLFFEIPNTLPETFETMPNY